MLKLEKLARYIYRNWFLLKRRKYLEENMKGETLFSICLEMTFIVFLKIFFN
jgi:hypothetical protein